MASASVSATASGPLFEGVAQVAVFHSAEAVVRELTDQGMERLRSAFPTGVPVKTGYYRSHLHAAVYGPRAQIDDSGVVYGPWLEGVSTRNQTTRFRGYATFRRATQWLEARAQGIADNQARQLAHKLGG